MKDSARYAKIVEWSEEDQCYGESSPGLIYAGCHGADKIAVFEQLCQVVEEDVKITITLSKKSVAFFKAKAAYRDTQYQRMIRRLLDAYVDAHADMQTSRAKRTLGKARAG